MSSLLEVDSIRKAFGDKQVLTDIALNCQSGDIIDLLGRNNSLNRRAVMLKRQRLMRQLQP